MLPENYSEAINSNDKHNWKAAMHDEINSLLENKSWMLEEKPKAQKILKSRWVYMIKSNPDGTKRHKARLIIKSYFQMKGIDYKKTFSPIIRFDTVRTLLSVAVRDGLNLAQFDVKTAFLYGSLKEDIYMYQPVGFNDGTAHVCKLLKSLHRLKQAPRCWIEHFTGFLESFSFSRSTADPCFYIF